MKEQPVVIQGAMEVETADLIEQMTEAREEPFGPWRCVRGLVDGHPVVVSETQWGMANAAALAALAIERYQPAAIISQGTAGAHDPALPPQFYGQRKGLRFHAGRPYLSSVFQNPEYTYF